MRMTPATVKVLQALMKAPDAQHYGYALMRATGLKSGSLYPILERLERTGWVDSQWEEIDDRQEGRPPRRYYQMTTLGQQGACTVIREFLAQFGVSGAGAQPRPSWGTAP